MKNDWFMIDVRYFIWLKMIDRADLLLDIIRGAFKSICRTLFRKRFLKIKNFIRIEYIYTKENVQFFLNAVSWSWAIYRILTMLRSLPLLLYISPSEKVNGYKKETSFIMFYGLSINQPYLPLSYGTTKTIIVIYEALSFAWYRL